MRIEISMMKMMLYVVLLNFSERILSSAMVDSILRVARYAPMMPVRMAASAAMPTMKRALLPMISTAEWKVGTDITPRISFRLSKYPVQEWNPSGTETMLTTAMALYAKPAMMIEMISTHFARFIGNRKWALSRETTSKPTKAQGARSTMLKIP